MFGLLQRIALKFPNRGWPCRYDFWLWVFILCILLFNFILVGDPLP